jgi:hypothetical protein
LTVDFAIADYGFPSYPAFGVSKSGILPRIGQLFNMNTSGTATNRHGVMAIGVGSFAEILANKGVKNAGAYGIYATDSSSVNTVNANASGAGTYGIFADDGSNINARGANASGAGTRGIHAINNSSINAISANASGAGTYGIFATYGSRINARGANASGAGTNGILAADGSNINAANANAQKGASPSSTDIVVGTGSIISANGATGGVSQTVNTITADGIIFQ